MNAKKRILILIFGMVFYHTGFSQTIKKSSETEKWGLWSKKSFILEPKFDSIKSHKGHLFIAFSDEDIQLFQRNGDLLSHRIYSKINYLPKGLLKLKIKSRGYDIFSPDGILLIDSMRRARIKLVCGEDSLLQISDRIVNPRTFKVSSKNFEIQYETEPCIFLALDFLNKQRVLINADEDILHSQKGYLSHQSGDLYYLGDYKYFFRTKKHLGELNGDFSRKLPVLSKWENDTSYKYNRNGILLYKGKSQNVGHIKNYIDYLDGTVVNYYTGENVLKGKKFKTYDVNKIDNEVVILLHNDSVHEIITPDISDSSIKIIADELNCGYENCISIKGSDTSLISLSGKVLQDDWTVVELLRNKKFYHHKSKKFAVVKSGYQYCIINHNFERTTPWLDTIIPVLYTYDAAQHIGDFIASKNLKLGVIDPGGKKKIPFEYDAIYKDGASYRVKKNGYWGAYSLDYKKNAYYLSEPFQNKDQIEHIIQDGFNISMATSDKLEKRELGWGREGYLHFQYDTIYPIGPEYYSFYVLELKGLKGLYNIPSNEIVVECKCKTLKLDHITDDEYVFRCDKKKVKLSKEY